MKYILHGRYAHAPYRPGRPWRRWSPLTLATVLALREHARARGWSL